MPQFNDPHGVAVDSGGHVFVADNVNNRIEKFNSDGKFIRKWGVQGTDNGQFDGPEGIGINLGTGNVYVADVGNDRIQEFSNSGGFIRTWGSSGQSVGSTEATTPVQNSIEHVDPFTG